MSLIDPSCARERSQPFARHCVLHCVSHAWPSTLAGPFSSSILLYEFVSH